MKTYLLHLRCSVLVDANSPEEAQRAWEMGLERELTVDTEGGVLSIELADEQRPPGDDSQAVLSNCLALDDIQATLSHHEWGAGTMNTVAEIVRRTGRIIEDIPSQS